MEESRRLADAMVNLDLNRHWFGNWAIQEKDTGILHGWTELSKLRPWSGPSDEIALSYVLRRQSWGCGIATEAAARLLRHAFEVHRLNRVMAVAMAENNASKRVLEKLGMRLIMTVDAVEGRKLDYFRIDGPNPET